MAHLKRRDSHLLKNANGHLVNGYNEWDCPSPVLNDDDGSITGSADTPYYYDAHGQLVVLAKTYHGSFDMISCEDGEHYGPFAGTLTWIHKDEYSDTILDMWIASDPDDGDFYFIGPFLAGRHRSVTCPDTCGWQFFIASGQGCDESTWKISGATPEGSYPDDPPCCPTCVGVRHVNVSVS